MILKGRYYMHTSSSNMCVLILDDHGSGTYEVQWWDIGKIGVPCAISETSERIYMHPDVWQDITEYLQEPVERWS